MKRTFTLFLCTLTVAVLFLAPTLILRGIDKNTYTLRAQKKAEKYTGTLELWHVVSFKTGGESGVSFLNTRIREFEKKNAYVFIELRAYTVEEALQEMEAGNFPDILSFPSGFLRDTSKLQQLEEYAEILPAYTNTGRKNGNIYAYPYMADFYTLSCNQDLFFNTDTSLPMESELNYTSFGEIYEGILPYTKGMNISAITLSDTYGLAPIKALSYLRGNKDAIYELSDTVTSGIDTFLDGETPILLAPAAESEKMLLDDRANSLSIKTYGLSTYTDLVQLVGIASSGDEAKMLMCQDFAQSLLSARAQNALEKLKMLPVRVVDDIYAGDALYLSQYELSLQGLCAASTFESEDF